MKFDYDKLSNETIIIQQLEVQSFEMSLYLVKLTVNGHSGMLFQNQTLKRFSNTQQIREAFEQFHVVEARMTHDSPYDEMIGNPPKEGNVMTLPFSMNPPY